MSNWFGDLQLAYKYIVVFLALLVLTILAGFVKVFFDRRKLNANIKKDAEAATVKEDVVELTANQREKDEGDLFGIRAIEAGFYAGVAQSRPTSRAGSIVGHPNLSSSTLVANPNSPLLKAHSHNGSTVSLALAGKNNNNRDSETLPDRRPPPPNMKLAPSEAELNGRHNPYDTAVDMSLNVPPSPGFSIQPTTFGGSDTDSDGARSPGTMSPRSADFNVQSYKPVPAIPMPDALRVSYHSGEEAYRSQAASFNDPSPRPSPGPSPTPLSPGHAPATRLPTLPSSALTDTPAIRVEEPDSEPKSTLSQTAAYHQRDASDASSVYSENRHSAYQSYQQYQSLDRSNSTASVKPPRAPSHLLELPEGAVKEARLSEFYDAYYRQSQILGPDAKPYVVDRQSTIMEIESPLPSPKPGKTFGHAA